MITLADAARLWASPDQMHVAPVRYQTFVAECGTHRPGGRFIPIEEVASPFTTEIAEGVIQLRIGPRDVLDESHWDVIDSLWAELVEACRSLQQDRSYRFYFPDQPLLLAIELDPRTGAVAVSVGDERPARTSRDEFLIATVAAAATTFQHLRRLFPKNAGAYDHQLRELRILDAELRGNS